MEENDTNQSVLSTALRYKSDTGYCNLRRRSDIRGRRGAKQRTRDKASRLDCMEVEQENNDRLVDEFWHSVNK